MYGTTAPFKDFLVSLTVYFNIWIYFVFVKSFFNLSTLNGPFDFDLKYLYNFLDIFHPIVLESPNL